jgi:ABC-2 type transport system permease protein
MNELVLRRKTSRLFRELNSVVTVAAREVTVFLKSPGTAIVSLAMPLVMMGMIGGNLMQNMAGGLEFDFGPFMLIGMLVNMLFMMVTMSMTSLVDDHEIDFNQEMLVSPVSRYSIVIGLIKNKKAANWAVMLITMPQMFLSGAIIPINHSGGALLVLSRLMPMTYCLDLTRAAVYMGTPDYGNVVMFNPVVNFLAISALTTVCLVIGTLFFARSEKNR